MTNQHKKPSDINDDEIRIISSFKKPAQPLPDDPEPRFPWWALVAVAVIIVVALALVLTGRHTSAYEDDEPGEVRITETTEITETPEPATVESPTSEAAEAAAPYTSLTDTVVGGRRLTVLQPRNAVARLVIGDSILDADGPVLVAQAADVCRDNRQIAGAYVVNGEMISRGKAKSGFCAIIGNEITVGVAQTTPLLERATEENGFFFRQYPLVYEGEIIENRLRNRSKRKALALLNDEVVVVLSHERLSLLDFSQALVDLGVKNAIYLTGSSAYLKAKLEDGRIYEFGERAPNSYAGSNYIFWQ